MIKPDEITIEEVDVKIIYIRFRGSYVAFRKQSRRLFKALFTFAEANNLIIPGVTKVLTMYDDNPFITEDTNLRTSIAMTIPVTANVVETDEICVSQIKGKFGVGHFELGVKDYEAAWQYMYQNWLLKEPHRIRDAVPFELYVTDPPKNFKTTSLTDIYLPIN